MMYLEMHVMYGDDAGPAAKDSKSLLVLHSLSMISDMFTPFSPVLHLLHLCRHGMLYR